MSINMKAIRILCTVFGCSVFASSNVFANESVTVYAAASLTNAVNELDAIYEQKNKVEVKTSYAGSSTLAKQIEAGAPADVFISADVQWMDYLQNKQPHKFPSRSRP